METKDFKAARQERKKLMQDIKGGIDIRNDKITGISIIICVALVLGGIVAAFLIINGVSFERYRVMDNAVYGQIEGHIEFGVSLKNHVNKGKVTLTFKTEEAAAKEFSRLEKLTNDFYKEQSVEGEYPNYYGNLKRKGNVLTFDLTEVYLEVFHENRIYSDGEVETLCDQISDVVFIYDRAGATWTYYNTNGSSTATDLVRCTMTYTLGPDMQVTGINVSYVFSTNKGVLEMKEVVQDESDQYYTNYFSYAVMLGLLTEADEKFEEYANMVETENTLSYDYSDIYIKLYNMTGGCMEDALRGFVLAGGEWNWIE